MDDKYIIELYLLRSEEAISANSSKRGHMLRTNGALSPF